MKVSNKKPEHKSWLKETVKILLRTDGTVKLALNRDESKVILSDGVENTIRIEPVKEGNLKIEYGKRNEIISQKELLDRLNRKLEQKLGYPINIEEPLEGKSIFASLIILKLVLRKLNY